MGYTTDLPDNEWQILEPLLAPKQKGRPRKHGLRAICNAIRYVQRTGVSVAFVAQRFSTVASRVHDVLALAEQRVMGTDHA